MKKKTKATRAGVPIAVTASRGISVRSRIPKTSKEADLVEENHFEERNASLDLEVEVGVEETIASHNSPDAAREPEDPVDDCVLNSSFGRVL